MLVVTRAGLLRQWSQGELRLYNQRSQAGCTAWKKNCISLPIFKAVPDKIMELKYIIFPSSAIQPYLFGDKYILIRTVVRRDFSFASRFPLLLVLNFNCLPVFLQTNFVTRKKARVNISQSGCPFYMKCVQPR